MKYTDKKSVLVSDLFFCAVFIPAMLALGPAGHWFAQWPAFAMTVTVFLVSTYFVITRVNFPELIISRRYVKIAIVVSILILCNYALTCFPLPKIDFVTPAMSAYQTRVRDYGISLSLWMMFSLVACYSFTMSFVKELYDRLLLQKKAEHQRDKAKLAVFRAQISPHFLFNTLNTLYSLVLGTSQKAEVAFVKFTEILKYTYTSIDKDKTTVEAEANYINSYIDLQKIRLGDCTKVVFSKEIDDSGMEIPPMILLTLVENAFKYGSSTSRECTVCISVSLKKGILEFESYNKIMKNSEEFRSDMPVGMENCRATLSAFFPGKHSLDAFEENGGYRVRLSIDLRDRLAI